MTSRRARNLLALAAGLAVVAAGCSTPPWEQSALPSPTGSADTVSPAPTLTPTPTAAAKIENDLARGSLKRTLTAGAAELKVTYWSTLDLGEWVPQVPKPLNVVASATLAGEAKNQSVYLSAVRVATIASAADGAPRVLDPVEDTADVKPGYLITKPSSFQQVFRLPAAPAGSRAVRITVTYELLIQSGPDATTYLRQATSDTLQVPLAG